MKISLIVSIFFVSCLNTPGENKANIQTVHLGTILEKKDSTVNKAPEEVAIATKLLDARTIVRPRVELRQGPGAVYFLNDQILAKGDQVIVLENYHRWRKVYSPQFKAVGWVHEQTVGDSRISNGVSHIELRRLPAIHTIHSKGRLRDYNSKEYVGSMIPKGQRYFRLKKVGRKYLVIVEDTLSVAWINEGDVI